jgi:hypothetical protein
MPPTPLFPPYYLGAIVCGGLAAYVRLRVRNEERRGDVLRMRRGLTALFVGLLVLTGVFGTLTVGEAVLASTWVYHYYLSVDATPGGAAAVVLPIPRDSTLLANLQSNRTTTNWTFVATAHGPGLYVGFSEPTDLNAYVRLFAPFGNHPDGALAPQTGNQSEWQVWIEYLGSGTVDINFQYGYGYTVAGAMVYIGTLTPGWAAYPLLPAS